MSHKIGNTWPIDAKNAFFSAELTVLYVCKLSESYLLPIQFGRPRNSARFFGPPGIYTVSEKLPVSVGDDTQWWMIFHSHLLLYE